MVKFEKTHAEKALDLERKAVQMSSYASQPKYKDTIKYEKYKKDVSKLYKDAAKEWIEQSKIRGGTRYNRRDSLSSAKTDYIKLKRLLNEYSEKEKINLLIDAIDEQLKKLKEKNKGGLEKKTFFSILSITTLLASLFFTSFSFTGNVVGNLTQNSSRFVGTAFFVLGLLFALCYFKFKK